jgi:hypothetical protein
VVLEEDPEDVFVDGQALDLDSPQARTRRPLAGDLA